MVPVPSSRINKGHDYVRAWWIKVFHGEPADLDLLVNSSALMKSKSRSIHSTRAGFGGEDVIRCYSPESAC